MLKADNIPRPLIKDNLANKLAQICNENEVSLLAIFGSFANGMQRKKSDVDILIQFNKNNEKSLLELVSIQTKLQRIFGRKVDLVTMDGLSPYIKNDVLSNMRVIYEG